MLRTARRLQLALAGRPLVRAELRWPDLGQADLAGRTVTEVVAHGKQILTRIAAADPTLPGPRIPTVLPEPLTLRSHLRMEGSWYVHARNAEPWPPRNRVSVRAVLGGAEWTAIGSWLGLLDLVPSSMESSLIGHLGPDIMADDFEPAGAAEALRRLGLYRQRPVGRCSTRPRWPASAPCTWRNRSLCNGSRRGRRSGRSTSRPCCSPPGGSCCAERPRHRRRRRAIPAADGAPGCTADRAGPANAAAPSCGLRRSVQRSRSVRRSTVRPANRDRLPPTTAGRNGRWAPTRPSGTIGGRPATGAGSATRRRW